MSAMGNKTQGLETSPNNSDHQYHLQPNNENKTQSPKISLYEQSREERIKENLQRLQQLGLKDLSNSLNSNCHLSSRRGRPRIGSKPPVTPLPHYPQGLETSPNNSDHQYHLQPNNENKTQSPKISLYEQSREERIKENLQRLQQLGLKDLSNSLNSNCHLSSRRGRPRIGSKPPVTPLPHYPQGLETSPNNSDHQYHLQPNNENKTQSPKISLYEQSREERIKENPQRLQQLGLKDLSNSLNSNCHLSSRRGRPRIGSKTPVTPLPPPLPPSASLRRSSRLQNTTSVTSSEVVLAKKDELLEDVKLKLRESEVYTEEHEKLLGNTEKSWTLFVDGYGNDGKRIYDYFKGKTCHQCRYKMTMLRCKQKTLGHRTHCSKCNMVQGQFCGDCLYMRYGEHVLEAIENPNWVCPVCRGICNCSFCRQAKGWAPTGSLYRKISQMGFKSVAHYLIQTRRVQTTVENNPDNIDQVSAKRSLSFPALELPSEESSEVNNNQKPQSGEDGLNSERKENNAYPEPNSTIIHQNSARKSLLFTKSEEFEKGESTEINLDVHGQLIFSELDSGNKKDDELKCEHEKELHFTEKEPNGSPVTLERRPGKKNAFSIEPSPNSIAGRIRQRHGKDSSNNDGTMGVNDKVLNVKQTVKQVVSETKVVKERETHNADGDIGEGYIASESSLKLMKRPASAMEHSPDDIAERLKQRCQRGKDHDEQGLPGANESVSDAKQVVENNSSGKESEANLKHSTSGTNMDCIARRLRPRNIATL